MKKTILALALLSAGAVFAQTDTTRTNSTTTNNTTNSTENTNMNTNTNTNMDNNGTLTNSSAYNAYANYTTTAPGYMNIYLQRDYPAASNVWWTQSGDWWHSYYMNGNQPMHVYYNQSGTSYTVSLPVRQNLVPESVIGKVNQMFGPTVYDVTTVRGSNGQDIYLVRTLENGQIASQWIGEDGSKVIDVYRVETTDMNSVNGMNNNMNSNTNTNMNISTTDNSTNTMSTDANANTTNSTNTQTMKTKTKVTDNGKKVKTKTKPVTTTIDNQNNDQ
jgi:hypothetical protein